MSEAQLQQSIILFFRNEYQRHGKGVIFSVPNESTFLNKKFTNTGVLKGVSDLIVILHEKIIFVELKAEKGTQSESQLKFQEQVENLHHEYYIIRSLETFKTLLKNIPL